MTGGRMKILRCVIGLGILVSPVVVVSTAGAAAPVKADKEKQGPLAPAITALTAEYAEQQKAKAKPGGEEKLREKSDYFAKDKPEGVTPEVVLAALEKPVHPDARADAYIKWQLLSAVEGKFPDNLQARALKIYKSSPQPTNHPGLNKQNLDRLLYKARVNSQSTAEDVNKEFFMVIAGYRQTIEPMLSYRDDLYARLTPNLDSYQAALADIYERITRGAPANEFWTNVSGGIRSWALGGGKPQQLKQMSGVIEKLEAMVKDERYKPYERVGYDNDKKEARWNSTQSIQNTKSMEDLSLWLGERANNPDAGMGFKDGDMKEKKK